MNLKQITIIMLAFFLGWALNGITLHGGAERPATISGYFSTEPIERLSPSDIISQEQIKIYQDRIIIEVDSPQWATFTNTKSMAPVFDQGNFALQIVPSSYEQIHPGDIISFTSDYAVGVIIHRVIETGFDEEGWYAITKGDNNPSRDPGKVRFENIKKLLIGIIY
jgi:hypothetical protein